MIISDYFVLILFVVFILFYGTQIDWSNSKTYKVSALTVAAIALGYGLLTIVLG